MAKCSSKKSKQTFRAKNTILHLEKEKTEKKGEYLKARKKLKKIDDNNKKRI